MDFYVHFQGIYKLIALWEIQLESKLICYIKYLQWKIQFV